MDPDEERLKVEAERRKTQGVAGEWEVVEQHTSNKPSDEADATSGPSKKREAEEPLDPEDTRGFKLRKKVAPTVTDELDADLIPIKLKVKKTEEVQDPTGGVKKEEESSQPTGAAQIKWTSRGWKRPEDESDGAPDSTISKDEEVGITPIITPEPVAPVPKPEAKEESEAPSVKAEPPTETVGETGAVFRKRKFGGNRGKR